MRFNQVARILFIAIAISNIFAFPANSADDEEGPQLISYTVSPSTNLNIGDRVIITLKMSDPGGSGIRNIQFVINDKFRRQFSPSNLAELSSPTFVCAGSNVCDYPFVFEIDQTWGNNGYAYLSSIRAFDLKANGTYFYDNGEYENLQSRSFYSGLHPLSNFRLQIGTPTPTPTPSPTPSPTPTPTPTPTPSLNPSPRACNRDGAVMTVATLRYICVNTGTSLVFLTETEATPYLEIKNAKIALDKIISKAYFERLNLLKEAKIVKDKVLRKKILEQVEVLTEFRSRYSLKVPNNENVLAGETELDQLSKSTSQLIELSKKLLSITCIKGKTTKKVSGTNPKCPKGYKKSA